MLAACGSSRGAQPYSGRLYSVAQVQAAFAALGLRLHTDSRRPGVVMLVNNHHLGQPYMGPVPRLLTVVVTDRRRAADSSASFQKRGHSRLTRYANVTVFFRPSVLDEVRGSLSTLRWGTPLARPGRWLIVPGGSIGGVTLGESRKQVEKAFGPGVSTRRGLVTYAGGRILVNYWFHDRLEKWVAFLQTRWGGFHTRSGVHVGSSRRELRRIYATCDSKTGCHLLEGPWPDALATSFTMHDPRSPRSASATSDGPSYSYWSASSTLSLPARRAGKMAAIRPATIAAITNTTSVPHGIVNAG
jgi:hypothetical protein